jgi:uncharacterized membrane protein
MKKIGNFIKTTLFGGLLVILPIMLTFFLMRWIFNIVSRVIEPLTMLIMRQPHMWKLVADMISVILIILVCFVIGLVVKTKIGRYLFAAFDNRILKIAPGYSLFKETLKQLVGQEKRPFSSVVLAKIFASDTLMTGFITDEHPDGRYTVYFPSALNPTTGLLCHLKNEDVQKIDVSVETAMRSIISCGVGSSGLFEKMRT